METVESVISSNGTIITITMEVGDAQAVTRAVMHNWLAGSNGGGIMCICMHVYDTEDLITIYFRSRFYTSDWELALMVLSSISAWVCGNAMSSLDYILPASFAFAPWSWNFMLLIEEEKDVQDLIMVDAVDEDDR